MKAAAITSFRQISGRENLLQCEAQLSHCAKFVSKLPDFTSRWRLAGDSVPTGH